MGAKKDQKRAEAAAANQQSKPASNSANLVANDGHVADAIDTMEEGANSTPPPLFKEHFSKSLADASTSYADALSLSPNEKRQKIAERNMMKDLNDQKDSASCSTGVFQSLEYIALKYQLLASEAFRASEAANMLAMSVRAVADLERLKLQAPLFDITPISQL